MATLPLPAAPASLARREIAATRLGTEGLARLSAGWRRRAFFSARVENVRFLELAKARIGKVVNQTGINRDRASFIAEMQRVATELGLADQVDPALRGTMQDITARRRLALIFDIQTGMARGEANWLAGLDPDLYNAAPAQELIRVEARRVPRDWPQRWKDAGGEFTADGRMIARKDSDIWVRLSRFGVPWPPYDFNSGEGVRNVRRREAVDLGLVGKGERLNPPDPESLLPGEGNADASTPTASLDAFTEPAASDLTRKFGDLVTVSPDGKSIALNETAVTDYLRSSPSADEDLDLGDIPAAGPGRSVTLAGRDLPDLLADPAAPAIDSPAWDSLPAVLWVPDEVTTERDDDSGEERLTFAARLGRDLWQAVVGWQVDSLVGRVARFWRTPGL